MSLAHHFESRRTIFLSLRVVKPGPGPSALRMEGRHSLFVCVALEVGNVHIVVGSHEASTSVVHARRRLREIMVAWTNRIEQLCYTYLAIMYGDTSGGHVMLRHEGPYDTECRWEEVPAVLKLLIYLYGLYVVDEKLGAYLCALMLWPNDLTGYTVTR